MPSDDEKKPDPAPDAPAPDAEAASAETPKPSPEDELKAAFGHLKSAAGIFFDRIAKDETLKKAATEAEGAVTRAASGAEKALGTVATQAAGALKNLGDRAEPMAKSVAKEIGDELGRVAKTVTSVFEPDPIPSDGKSDEAKPGEGKSEAKTSPDDMPGDDDEKK